MKRVFFMVTLGSLMLSTLAIGQSGFDGTWKIDVNKVDFSKKPDVYLLQNGMYDCKTCTPPYRIKADGSDQPVTGHPYYDAVAIKVVNDHEIEKTTKKDGKVVGTVTSTLSADDKTMTFKYSDSSGTNGGPPVTGEAEAVRVAKGPAGSNAISGSWRTTKQKSLSDNAIVLTYKVNGDELTMTNLTGQSYTAKLDGADAPMKGDPGVTSVSVKMIGKIRWKKPVSNAGKVIGVFKMKVAADGKSAKASYNDKESNETTDFHLTKQ